MRICRGHVAICKGIQGCIGIMKGFSKTATLPPMMENQVGKELETEMETLIIKWLVFSRSGFAKVRGPFVLGPAESKLQSFCRRLRWLPLYIYIYRRHHLVKLVPSGFCAAKVSLFTCGAEYSMHALQPPGGCCFMQEAQRKQKDHSLIQSFKVPEEDCHSFARSSLPGHSGSGMSPTSVHARRGS